MDPAKFVAENNQAFVPDYQYYSAVLLHLILEPLSVRTSPDWLDL